MFQNKFCKTKKQVYYKQAMGIGGREGIFDIRPLTENFSKIPPWRFRVKPPFCFFNELETLKFTLIQLDIGLNKAWFKTIANDL